MKKPRLLVLAKQLPLFQGNLENSLYSLLYSNLDGINVNGSIALPYSADSLLNWSVLGRNTNQDIFLTVAQKGCELYIGIKTQKEEYANMKTKDGKFDIYQLGERGFYLAKKKGIPAMLLDNYDEITIYNFVKHQTE